MQSKIALLASACAWRSSSRICSPQCSFCNPCLVLAAIFGSCGRLLKEG